MAFIPMVRALVLRPHLDLLRQIGGPTARLLEASGLSWAPELNPETLLPLCSVCDFYQRIARAEGEQFTWNAVERTDTVRLQAGLTKLLIQARTPGKALQMISGMVHPISSGLRSWGVVRGESLWACDDYIVGIGHGRNFAIHYVLVSLIHYARVLLGPNWQPDEILVQLPPTPWFSNTELLSGARIRFNQPVNAVRLPLEILATQFPEKLLSGDDSEIRTSTQLLPSIRQYIDWRLRDGVPGLAEAADAAGTSVRTLQRELAAAGQSFSSVLDTARFEQARMALTDPDSQVTNVAFKLGFTDSANFTRAFRRWTGLSPREWRLLRGTGAPAH